jgi:hypothetical protein
MDHRHSERRAGFRDVTGTVAVDGKGALTVALGLIDRGIGCRIHDEIRTQLAEHGAHRLAIRHVEIGV